MITVIRTVGALIVVGCAVGWLVRLARGEATVLDERRRPKPAVAIVIAFLAVALAGTALVLLPGIS